MAALPERRAHGSTAEQIAEVVYEAAIDDSDHVTFVADAGADAFRAGVRQMFLG